MIWFKYVFYVNLAAGIWVTKKQSYSVAVRLSAYENFNSIVIYPKG